MAVLDRRLVRHVRGVRVMLAADAVLGVVVDLLVLAQAVLLARTAARAFGGAALDELRTSLIVLAAVVAARAAAAYGFEAGRHAAMDAVSTLRLRLVGAASTTGTHGSPG